MRYLKQSTATTITIGPLTDETDGVTPITTVTVGDITAAVIKGTARTALTLTASGGSNDFTHIGDGYWSLELTATDTGTLGALRVTLRDDDGFLPVWEDFTVFPANVYDSLVAGSDSLEVDATLISGGTAAADNVEANIGNLDAAVSSRLAASAAPTNFGDLAITASTGKVTVNGTVDANLTQIDGQATSGNNATLNLKQLNVVNSAGDAVVASSTGGNGVGINASGNGSGDGLKATGGATGHGLRAVGGATSGDGLRAECSGAGDGIDASGGGSNGHGLRVTGSANGTGMIALGNGTGAGVQCSGGASGHGLRAIGGSTGVQDGFSGISAGSGAGFAGDLDSAFKADVNAEVDAALVDIDLDHWIGVSAGAEKPTVGSYLDKVMNKNGSQTFDATADSLEAIRDRGDADWSTGTAANPNVLEETTIATVSSQTQFTLTDGPDFDDAFNGQTIVLYDASNNDFPSVRVVNDYVGATKTVTIDAAPDFTIVVSDGVKVFATAPGSTAPTAAQVADAVWDEDVETAHGSAGSAGEKLHTAKAMVSNRRTHTVSTGVDQVFADDGSTLLRTMTPTDDGDDLVTVVPS